MNNKIYWSESLPRPGRGPDDRTDGGGASSKPRHALLFGSLHVCAKFDTSRLSLCTVCANLTQKKLLRAQLCKSWEVPPRASQASCTAILSTKYAQIDLCRFSHKPDFPLHRLCKFDTKKIASCTDVQTQKPGCTRFLHKFAQVQKYACRGLNAKILACYY